MELSLKEKEILLSAARESIKSLFGKADIPTVDYKVYPNLKLKAGAFVTLKIKNELRGCIGYITSEQPLFETICEVAKHAAIQDPRFPQLTQKEFISIDIEISVLSPMKKISDYKFNMRPYLKLQLKNCEKRQFHIDLIQMIRKWFIAVLFQQLIQR